LAVPKAKVHFQQGIAASGEGRRIIGPDAPKPAAANKPAGKTRA
jgi:hypothetical protein